MCDGTGVRQCEVEASNEEMKGQSEILWMRAELRLRDVLRKVRARERRVGYTMIVSLCATAHR